MKFRINLYVRRFRGKKNKSSGFYTPVKRRSYHRSGVIDINLADSPLEQAFTIFHEVTHMVFDLFSQYEMDHKSVIISKRTYKLRKEWRTYNKEMEERRKDKTSREEFICCKVENAVRKIFKHYIPKKYKKQLFTKSKKRRIM